MIDPDLLTFAYQCAKCRILIADIPPAFEGFLHEYFTHLKNFKSDNYTRVKPVCPDCFANHFAQYETADIQKPAAG